MTAKEMFEKLGYKYKQFEKLISYHLEQQDKNCKNCYGIAFNLEYKCYHTYSYGWFENGIPFDSNLSIDMKLQKAINKQIEELGWNK